MLLEANADVNLRIKNEGNFRFLSDKSAIDIAEDMEKNDLVDILRLYTT